MGCVNSSSHKRQKKYGLPASKQDQADQERAATETNNNNAEGKRNVTTHDQVARVGTEQNTKAAGSKETQRQARSKKQGPQSTRKSVKDTAHGGDCHGHRKNSTKETNEKTGGAGNHHANANQPTKQEDIGRILDEELLRELEKDVKQASFHEDSIAVDFEELRKKETANKVDYLDIKDEKIDEEKGNMSLTLNLTDLKIEKHS